MFHTTQEKQRKESTDEIQILVPKRHIFDPSPRAEEEPKPDQSSLESKEPEQKLQASPMNKKQADLKKSYGYGATDLVRDLKKKYDKVDKVLIDFGK